MKIWITVKNSEADVSSINLLLVRAVKKLHNLPIVDFVIASQLEVVHSDKPIKSIELQLVRVETCGEFINL